MIRGSRPDHVCRPDRARRLDHPLRLGSALLLGLGMLGCESSATLKRIDLPTVANRTAAYVDEPCLDIDDATLRSVGMNPESRRSVQPSATETSACFFRSSDLDLRVAASRVSFEEYRDSTTGKGISEGLDIGIRPAQMVRRPGPEGTCELAMKTDHGTILLTTVISVASREWGMDRCGRMRQIATAIEPTIGRR